MNDKQYLKNKRKEIKEANLTFNRSFLVLFFTIPMSFSLTFIISVDNIMIKLFILFVNIIAIILTYLFSVRIIINNIKARRYGEIVQAKVIGYCDDNYLISEETAKIIILSTITTDGEKTIYYQSANTKQEYEINSLISLFKYNDIYLIKNEKTNRKEKIIGIIILFVLAILVCWYLIFFMVHCVFNSTFYDLKMYKTLKDNEEFLTNIDTLEYKIPDGYKLSGYDEYRYYFTDRNENHFCTIDIYSFDSLKFKEKINTCNYLDINNHYVDDEEKIINGSKWCYRISVRKEQGYSFEEYYINDGNHYYAINFGIYNNGDEKCSIDFINFLDSIKINN